MRTPESIEKAEIDSFLKSIGAYFISPATYGYGASGTPDRVCCLGGKFIGIEVKREGKEPTPIQERRMSEIRRAGGVTFWGTAEKVIGEMKQWLQVK